MASAEREREREIVESKDGIVNINCHLTYNNTLHRIYFGSSYLESQQPTVYLKLPTISNKLYKMIQFDKNNEYIRYLDIYIRWKDLSEIKIEFEHFSSNKKPSKTQDLDKTIESIN